MQGYTYYNDNDAYCCKVLRKNIRNGNLPEGYIDERDIRDVRASDLVGYQHIHLFAGIGGFPLGFKWANFPASISLITGGFPCQDISNAGKRAGITGERSGLWSEMYRLICELRPQYVIVENVSTLLNRGMGTVLADLATCGYDAEWQVLSAAQFGAPHLRRRVFIVAYPNGNNDWIQSECRRGRADTSFTGNDGQEEYVAYAPGRQRKWGGFTWARGNELADRSKIQNASSRREWKRILTWPTQGTQHLTQQSSWWAIESAICRVAHGIPRRVDRLRGLGNALMPQIAQYIAACIMAYEQEREAA